MWSRVVRALAGYEPAFAVGVLAGFWLGVMVVAIATFWPAMLLPLALTVGLASAVVAVLWR